MIDLDLGLSLVACPGCGGSDLQAITCEEYTTPLFYMCGVCSLQIETDAVNETLAQLLQPPAEKPDRTRLGRQRRQLRR